MDGKMEVETISEVDRAGDFYAERVGVNVAIDHRIGGEIKCRGQHEKEAYDA
ncbi:MAG: hypothetical protein H0U04_18420 [Rubrobacter sp.]|nr:hypothetical protein [Rubrobacter sp.]